MGVHDLWRLLGPCGNRVNLETLAGKRLAVDVSIWLVQFVKAMRDPEGNMVENAHLLGMFRRICRLLFHRIKPVFVFDGPAPALKRRTVAERQRQRQKQRSHAERTAERILLQQLNIKRIEVLRRKLQRDTADEARFESQSKTAELELRERVARVAAGEHLELDVSEHKDDCDDVYAVAMACGRRNTSGDISDSAEEATNSKQGAVNDESDEDADGGDDDDDDLVVPSGVVLAPEAIARLPRSIQYDVMQQQRFLQRQLMGDQFERAKDSPTAFSSLQLNKFLKASAVNKKIDQCRLKMNAEYSYEGMPANRIASEVGKHYVLHRRRGGSGLKAHSGTVSSAADEGEAEYAFAEPPQRSEAEANIDRKCGRSRMSEQDSHTDGEDRDGDDCLASAGGFFVDSPNPAIHAGGLSSAASSVAARDAGTSSERRSGKAEAVLHGITTNDQPCEQNARAGQRECTAWTCATCTFRNLGRKKTSRCKPVDTCEMCGIPQTLMSSDTATREFSISSAIAVSGAASCSWSSSGHCSVSGLAPPCGSDRGSGVVEEGGGEGALVISLDAHELLANAAEPDELFPDSVWEECTPAVACRTAARASDDGDLDLDHTLAATPPAACAVTAGAVSVAFPEEGAEVTDLSANLPPCRPTVMPVARMRAHTLSPAFPPGLRELAVSSGDSGDNDAEADGVEILDSAARRLLGAAIHLDVVVVSDTDEDVEVDGPVSTLPGDFADSSHPQDFDSSTPAAAPLAVASSSPLSLGKWSGESASISLSRAPAACPPLSLSSLSWPLVQVVAPKLPSLSLPSSSPDGDDLSTAPSPSLRISTFSDISPSHPAVSAPLSFGSSGRRPRVVIPSFNDLEQEAELLRASHVDRAVAAFKSYQQEHTGSGEGEDSTLASATSASLLSVSLAPLLPPPLHAPSSCRQEPKPQFSSYFAPSCESSGSKGSQAQFLDVAQEQAMSAIVRLQESQQAQKRGADHVTEDMVAEAMALLSLFGIPYVVAPAEAEAQCAALESLCLVDGVVTDDSDTFLFGAQTVYRNIFEEKKYAEQYYTGDIERDYGLDREKLICLAMLLGSDYTPGVRGVGIVNAIEIVNAFPGEAGLVEFREWVFSDDSPTRPRPLPSTHTVDQLAAFKKALFKYTHRNIRMTWELSPHFPDTSVFKSYWKPVIDDSDETFEWGKPDFSRLRIFCEHRLGWTREKMDATLAPIVRACDTLFQTRLDSYVRVSGKAGNVRSERIRRAIAGLTRGPHHPDGPGNVKGDTGPKPARKRQRTAGVTKGSEGDERDSALAVASSKASKRASS